ncbi:hook-length control protein FliK [Bradyrhizobium erythrophlei]|uniref:Hook-length control protein FliK n=1 Tax=Bradyrhizobium erythrophlei TaxID=1437360 RepID=A0A1M5JC50_9BRAD|nr:hook-length control protein FliK [Bradyrhizobium erythrophlei]
MTSVTSDAPTNLSFQAPPRPARYDQPSRADNFGALLDSNTTPNTSNDSATLSAQAQPASQRRYDDAPAASDNTPPPANSAANQAASNDSSAGNSSASQPSGANTSTSSNTVQQTGSNSDSSKASTSKSTGKSSSDKTSAADPSAAAQPGGPSVTMPNPIAVAIPVIIASTNAPAAPAGSGNATTPLAIAAAAIAATSSAGTSSAAAAPAQTTTGSAAAASASATATNAAVAAADASAKNVRAAPSDAVATGAKGQATPTNATAATDGSLAVANAAPVIAKATPLKAPVATQAKTAASGASDTASGNADPSATATPADAAQNAGQQPAIAGKPEAGNGSDTAKADASGDPPSISASAASAHDSLPVGGHAPTGPSDTGAQATGSIQPQLPAIAATAAPVGPLTVTAASHAAVPLSGLALEIAASAKNGKSSFEIRLDPADLGRIDVRIDVDRNGQVTSHLTVEKPETLSMLRQDAPQLQRQLDDAGFKTGDNGLQFSLRDQSSSGQNSGNQNGRNAQHLVISEDAAIPTAVAGRSYGRMLGSSSGVDISV